MFKFIGCFYLILFCSVVNAQASLCQSLFESKKNFTSDSGYSERSKRAFNKLNTLQNESDLDFFISAENQKTRLVLKEHIEKHIEKYQKQLFVDSAKSKTNHILLDFLRDILRDLSRDTEKSISHNNTTDLLKASLGFVTFLTIDSKIQKTKERFFAKFSFFKKHNETDQSIENDLAAFYQKRIWERIFDVKHSKLLITFSNITVNEMIYFEALGIVPIQLVLSEKKVHNEVFDPLQFALHDLGHALVYRGVSKLFFAQRLRFADSLRDYIRTIADPVKSRVAQFLIFYMMHEKGVVIDNINKRGSL